MSSEDQDQVMEEAQAVKDEKFDNYNYSESEKSSVQHLPVTHRSESVSANAEEFVPQPNYVGQVDNEVVSSTKHSKTQMESFPSGDDQIILVDFEIQFKRHFYFETNFHYRTRAAVKR